MWEIYNLDRNGIGNASVRWSPCDLHVVYIKTIEYRSTRTLDISKDYEFFRREISGSVRRCSGQITGCGAGRLRSRLAAAIRSYEALKAPRSSTSTASITAATLSAEIGPVEVGAEA